MLRCANVMLRNYFCRTKDHPSPSLDEYCTRMSLRLSEDNNWESTNCGTVNSAVAACQYQNKAVDNQERNGTDVSK